MRIERVPLLEFAESAAAILRASWQPPCLEYSADYIRWQFGYPGHPEGKGVAAFDSCEPIGFAAVVPRSLAFGGERHPALLLSFVSVRPNFRGQGVGHALYQALTEIARQTGVPVLSFAETGTAGSRLLTGSLLAAGYYDKNLGPRRAHAGIAKDHEHNHPRWAPCNSDE
ncbi:MAG TPA: GNAT family N-acetyltransferase, partial [Isosphaeraceae bacterium]|nr:GNAT family N-acetyltransferase [Isosphaeraceae bacterium]